MSRQHTLLGGLFAAVLISALAVVYSKHQSRALFIELQTLQTARDELGIEWGRLQLEQSAWAAHGRIETVATERLHMRLPPVSSIIAVAP
ncbi:MAG: cell division protein FtsL [Pseudomonadota bacterium]|jgi:cell division protein FtsL|nr:cell division protein FtsL [Pseudomonadota bacterium]